MTETLNIEGFEPQKNNRFIVEFPKEFGLLKYCFISITMPKLLINSGFHVWKNIEVTMLDPIAMSSTAAVMKIVDFCKEKRAKLLKDGTDFNDIFLFSFNIITLDATGCEIENFKIDIQELVSVDFGNYDYGDDGFKVIKIEMKPSNCTLLF